MRFAAIADIHGNLHALEAMLADIADQGIADVVNLGDHVSGPLAAAKTADLLMVLDFVAIRGDQDRRLLEACDNGKGSSKRRDFQELDPCHFEWMAAQPETLLYRDEVLLRHGSPKDDACYWLDHVTPEGGIQARSLTEVEADAEGVSTSLILCAHTHLPRSVRLSDGRMAVNPSSVGLPGYDGQQPVYHIVQTGTPDACYAILEQTRAGWSAAFRHVPYDSTAMAAMAAAGGLPKWANATISTGWFREAQQAIKFSIMPDPTRLNPADPALYHEDRWQPVLEQLRAAGPLHYCPESLYGPYWSVCSYDLIMEVELQPLLYSNRADLGGIQINDIAKGLGRPAFVSMDPPEHTPRRRAVAPISNRSSLRQFEELIRARTCAVLDSLPRGEPFDWVERVSKDLTAMMLATMLDWPQERRLDLLYWSDVATANLHAPNPLVRTEEERYAVLEEIANAFAPLWQARNGDGAGFDLISMLANSESTAQMSRAEFIGTLFLLIVGGNDATRNSMTGTLLALQQYPGEWVKVQDDPSLIPIMVSETIRWQTPVIHMRRTATADAELAGQQIKAGDKVVLWYTSGNRDADVFDDPDTFRAARKNARRHLAFGAGVHRCVGDQLAEQQLRILWEEVRRRSLRFEIVEEPERTYSNFIRGFSKLTVKRT